MGPDGYLEDPSTSFFFFILFLWPRDPHDFVMTHAESFASVLVTIHGPDPCSRSTRYLRLRVPVFCVVHTRPPRDPALSTALVLPRRDRWCVCARVRRIFQA